MPKSLSFRNPRDYTNYLRVWTVPSRPIRNMHASSSCIQLQHWCARSICRTPIYPLSAFSLMERTQFPPFPVLALHTYCITPRINNNMKNTVNYVFILKLICTAWKLGAAFMSQSDCLSALSPPSFRSSKLRATSAQG